MLLSFASTVGGLFAYCQPVLTESTVQSGSWIKAGHSCYTFFDSKNMQTGRNWSTVLLTCPVSEESNGSTGLCLFCLVKAELPQKSHNTKKLLFLALLEAPRFTGAEGPKHPSCSLSMGQSMGPQATWPPLFLSPQVLRLLHGSWDHFPSAQPPGPHPVPVQF